MQAERHVDALDAVIGVEIPVLSLWEPWATLIALGVKRIETRSWSTRYRGPLAIHAASRRPEVGLRLGNWRVTQRKTGLDAGFHLSRFNIGTPIFPPSLVEDHLLVLGSIVAIATLADVVPMVPAGTHTAGRALTIAPNSALALVESAPTGEPASSGDVTEESPFGLYQPGRFGLLLDDVTALRTPVAFRGGQRLTRRWTPTAVELQTAA